MNDLIVFFKNSRGERREIGKASSEKEAFKVSSLMNTNSKAITLAPG